MKLTPWFPPEVKPVRVGVYEVESWTLYGPPSRQKWNGKSWQYKNEMTGKWEISWTQNKRWRGLAEPPK